MVVLSIDTQRHILSLMEPFLFTLWKSKKYKGLTFNELELLISTIAENDGHIIKCLLGHKFSERILAIEKFTVPIIKEISRDLHLHLKQYIKIRKEIGNKLPNLNIMLNAAISKLQEQIENTDYMLSIDREDLERMSKLRSNIPKLQGNIIFQLAEMNEIADDLMNDRTIKINNVYSSFVPGNTLMRNISSKQQEVKRA